MNQVHRIVQAVLLACLLAVPALDAENWSRFRGPNGSGVSEDTGYPTSLGPDTNLIWKAEVRPSKSSPVLTARHVFVTGFAGGKLFTQCLNRKTGKLLWERSIERQREPLVNKLNDPAALTPVTDGENVYAFFQDWGLVSYDPAGNLRWKTPLGPFANSHGLGISPIVADGLLVIQVDQFADSYIAAFDLENGETVWKTNRSESESWSTPVFYRTAGGAPYILTVGDRMFGAHQLKSGRRTFTESSMAGAMVASPILEGDTLYAFGYNFGNALSFDGPLEKRDKDGDGKLAANEYKGSVWLTGMAKFRGNKDGILDRQEWDAVQSRYTGPSPLVAMRLEPGSNGGTLRTRELWRYEKGFKFVIPSPLIYDNVLYYVKNGGIFTAIDAQTGKLLKQGRLEGAIDPYSASPVAADGKIYLASENGKVSVVRPGADWEMITVNHLEGEIFATPALSDGKIFVRTAQGLYCFGK